MATQGGYTAVMGWPQFSLRKMLLATAVVAVGSYAASLFPSVAIALALAIAYLAVFAAVVFLYATTIVGAGRLACGLLW